MSTGVVHFFENSRLISANGSTTGATVYFYYSKSSNLAPIYTNSSLTVPAQNPYEVASGAIVPNIILDPRLAYRRRIVFADGTVSDVDPVPMSVSSDAFNDLRDQVSGAIIGVDSYASVADLPVVTSVDNGKMARVYSDVNVDNNTYWVVRSGGWMKDVDFVNILSAAVKPLIDRTANEVVNPLVEAAQLAANDATLQAAIASAVSTALLIYTGGYIGVNDPLPPEGVGEGEGYQYTDSAGRLFGALNVGGQPSNIFEIPTAAMISQFGTEIIRHLRTAAKAIPLTLNDLFKDQIMARSFGAKGDYITDDAPAIQAAVDEASARGGGTVVLPYGDVRLGSTVEINAENVYIKGQGPSATRVYPTQGCTLAFRFGSQTGPGITQNGLTDLMIDCSRVASATGLELNRASSFWFNAVTINYPSTAIRINGGVIQYFTNFIFNLVKDMGFEVNGGNDQFFTNGIVSNTPGDEPTTAGMLVRGTDAFWMDNVDFIKCKIPMLMQPENGAHIQWVFINNSAFDTSSGPGVQISPGVGSRVLGVQFNSSWSATNQIGLAVLGNGTVDGVAVNGSRFFNNREDGALAATGNNITFDACTFTGNSGSNPGVYAGINIQAGVSNFAIRGCTSGASNGFPVSQGRGILINPGPSDSYLILGNNLQGNVNESLYDGGTGDNKHIVYNLGAKTTAHGQGDIPAGQTSVVVAHGLAFTPLPKDVSLTPVANLGAVGASTCWVSATDATTITINVDASVTSPMPIGWQARVKGA